jgi:acyl-CoA synthetase (AMP-forming)/AMP-acid ligase II/alkylation response protein AidB-like acyl-CoA dehydrogenase/acyl carrier protein
MVSSKRETFSTIWYKSATLIDVLQLQAQKQGNSTGFYFLQAKESLKLSYGDLDRQAKAIATHLQARYSQGERILLMYQPSLELIAGIMGCMYAGAIAVPVYPPRRNRNLNRLMAIAQDAQASGILTTVAQKLSLLAEDAIALPIIATDGISGELAESWQTPTIDANSIALLQYTSGSTGKPKGVMLTHGNLLHNLAQIYHCFAHDQTSHVVSWLPPYHDMGLIGGIFQPLYGGFPVTLMAPVSFLQKPIRWLQTISQSRATTSGAPNFAYEMCLNISPDDCQNLDLSSWELAFTGAEPIRAQTLEKFVTTFAPYGFRKSAFYACYGLAEATLFVTGGRKGKAPKTINNSFSKRNLDNQNTGKTIVSCGFASGEQTVIVVNPQSRQRCEDGEEGEIWISGASVAQGYWNRSVETEETFKAVLASGKGEFLRTGDLGICQDGELFVTGRIKDIIVIRGCNYYPQDIEATVAQSHETLSKHWGAALSVEIDGEEKLVIVQEVERNAWRSLDTTAIILAIRSAISHEHELQVYAICLLKPSSIPKTSSGKVQRYACKEVFVNDNLDVIYRWQLSDLQGKGENLKPLDLHQRGSSTTDKLIHWLRDYASQHINSQLIDERRCIPPHIVLDFGNQGLLGMQVPPSYGGLGLGHTDTIRILQQLGAIDTTLALFVGLNNVLGIRPILLYGSPSLKAELLPILATGRELAAFALTEPGAGANPQAIASQAIPNATGWQLRGEKIWSGSAAWAGVINVFVQQQNQGISGFVVRRGTPGLRQGKEALTMGMRGMVQNTVYLEEVAVTSEQLLGKVGAGMNVAQDAMMYGRLAIASACVGGMKRCVQLMWRYSDRRQIATGKLIEHPVVLRNLDELVNAITAVETLVMKMAQLLDQGINLPVEAYTACKISAPEFYWQAADLLIQTLGGRGYIETNLAPQILRDARVLRIFEGPTETLCGFLGASVFKQGEALDDFLTHTLGAGEVAQRLANATQQVSSKFAHDSVSQRLTVERWVYHQLGELASDAILWGAMQGSIHTSNQQTISWIKSRFDAKLQQILSFSPNNLPLANLQLAATQINEYTQAIGDIEQTLPGEEYHLDELLRKPVNVAQNAQKMKKTGKMSIPQEYQPLSLHQRSLPDTVSQKKYQEIQTWLIKWLSQKLHIQTGEISPNRAFADYGMDSVTAVELAHDLQEWLNISQPLEATIAWNFPTIEELAGYLSQNHHNTSEIAENNPDKSTLEELSTAEMAVLLAQEIAIAKQRRQS